ncbi:MAG: transglycosylase domain-containing protein, partial [Desulfobulbaceae bacterium]|nr:transglycosylase domain-containing protein [Desulfobulbaceae bacterium]
MKQNNDQKKGRVSEPENVRRKPMDEPAEARQKAVKFKAFRHIFSEKDIKKGVEEKTIGKKLRQSRYLENRYYAYMKALEKNPTKKMLFPWDSPFRRSIFFAFFWGPKFLFWGGIICLILFIVNYIPGPTQHTIELLIARSLYDTSRNIDRLPENLATYAHSASIVDESGSIIKAYGKREVTRKIPDRARRALLACEDHYLLPHKNNPWYVNSFLIHAGVSWVNLLGAVKDTLMGHTRGASTIVMQNAKKMLGNDERNIGNKIEEIIIAYLLVSKFGKENNLDFYINTVPVGGNIYGFSAAAKNYFKKELDDLNMQQLVTVCSFIPNHNRQIAFYEIVKGKNFSDLSKRSRFHANESINKINVALAYLRGLEEITEEEYRFWRLNDEASIRKIGFRDFHSPLYGEEEWTSWNVIKEVCSRSYLVNGREISGARLILDEKGDVVVETGVDLVLVEKIKEVISEFLKSKKFRKILWKRNLTVWHKDVERYEKRKLTPPYEDFEGFMENLYRNINIGVIAINRQGEIIAHVGGKEFLRDSTDPDTTANSSTINPSSSGR